MMTNRPRQPTNRAVALPTDQTARLIARSTAVGRRAVPLMVEPAGNVGRLLVDDHSDRVVASMVACQRSGLVASVVLVVACMVASTRRPVHPSNPDPKGPSSS